MTIDQSLNLTAFATSILETQRIFLILTCVFFKFKLLRNMNALNMQNYCKLKKNINHNQRDFSNSLISPTDNPVCLEITS